MSTRRRISTVTTSRRSQAKRRATITTKKTTRKTVAITKIKTVAETKKRSSTSTKRSTVSSTTKAPWTTPRKAVTKTESPVLTTIQDQSSTITIESSTTATNAILTRTDSVRNATSEMDQLSTRLFAETTISQTQLSNETNVESTSASPILLLETTETDSTDSTFGAKPNSIVLYLVFGLFSLLLGMVAIALAAFYFCCHGKRKKPFAEQLLDGMSKTTNTDDTNPESHQPSTSSGLSQTPSTALSTHNDESQFFMKPTKSYAHTFNDDSF